MNMILKRLLNVISVLATLFLLVLCWTMISGSVTNWFLFTEKNLVPLFLVYVAIFIINYVVFGKLVIWHKKITVEPKS